MREKGAPNDAALAALARRQHGVVTTAQLEAAGFDKSAVARRLDAGRLHRIHQGVYAVGHSSSITGDGGWRRCSPAVLARCRGTRAPPRSGGSCGRPRAPSTSPCPADPAAGAGPGFASTDPRRSGRATSAAARTSPSRPRAERSTTFAEPSRPSSSAAPPDRPSTPATASPPTARSDLELYFVAFCRRHRLPPPEVNVRTGNAGLGHFTVDFLWPARRLVVETDSYEYHRGDVAFEDDHESDLALRQLGFEVLRYTGHQLEHHGAEIAAEVRTRLG